jgi:DNA-binding SARP family transcriptional activator/LysM repeat protein
VTNGSRQARIAAAVEWALALVGVPVGLVLVGAVPSWPKWPSAGQLRAFFAAPTTDGLPAALIHPALWLVWILWGYLIFAFGLSALGHLLARGGDGGAGVLRMRRLLVPAALCGVIDMVLVGSMALGIVGSPRSWMQAAVAATAAPVPTTPQTAPPPPQATTPAPSTTYLVERGDTLSGIAAQAYGSPADWPVIWEADKGHPEPGGRSFDDPNRIWPGWELPLPAGPPSSPPADSPASGSRSYIVQKGDTLDGIAGKELGSEAKEPELFADNVGHVVGPDGEVLRMARYILPGWRLQLPDASSQSQAPNATSSVPPDLEPPPAPLPPPSPQAPTAPAQAPAPLAPPSAAKKALRPVAGPAGKTRGIRIPGGWLPYSLAAGLAGVAYLARLRRRSRRRLDDPEPRRALGAVLGAVAGGDRVLDSITPHTLSVLEVWQASGAATMPRVLAAWEAEEGIAYLLDVDPADLPPDGMDGTGTIQVRFGEREGKAVAVTQALKHPGTYLRRPVVPFQDELLVPVGRRDGEGWLHLPLLNRPLAVVGERALETVRALLLAAAVRTGELDLRISAAPGLLDGVRLPEGVELPAIEVLTEEQLAALAATLAEEARERTRQIHRDGFETFADLQTLWPASIPAWVLVLDPASATACAAELDELSRMGVGAVVLGEWPAERRIVAGADSVAVSAPGVGYLEGLEPVQLPPSVVEELEAEARPVQPVAEVAPTEAAAGTGSEAGEAVDPGEPLARIRIHLLGGYRVSRDGEELPLSATSSASARELVARLAVAHPDRVSGKVLREDLWPDDLDPQNDREQALFQTVSRARRWLLGTSAKGGEVIQLLPGGWYALRGVWVDVAAFRAKAGQGSRAALQEALDLYRGPLLAGQETDTHYRWVTTGDFRDQERFRSYRVLAGLAEAALSDGDAEGALAVLEAALADRDGAAIEGLACLAMRAEAARGSADGVRRRYGRLVRALEVEEASGATVELYRGLLASLEQDRSRRRRPAPIPPALHVVSPSTPSVSSAGERG